MAMHVNFSLLMCYRQSTLGFTFVNFFASVTYFLVRLSAPGQLVMRAASFVAVALDLDKKTL